MSGLPSLKVITTGCMGTTDNGRAGLKIYFTSVGVHRHKMKPVNFDVCKVLKQTKGHQVVRVKHIDLLG